MQNLISPFVLQHLGFLFLVILTLARFSGAATASPSEKLWEEIGNVKTMMAAVSGKTVSGRTQNLLLYKNYCLLASDAVLFNRQDLHYVLMYIYSHTHIHTHTYINTYIHTHTHMYTHIHTHTHT